MTLPYDYARCKGETPDCPQRETCARHRDIPRYNMVIWNSNLNEEGTEQCPYYIKYLQFEAD